MGTLDFSASASSFHTALDVPADRSPHITVDPNRTSPGARQLLHGLDTDVQLGREYQSSPIHGPGGMPTQNLTPLSRAATNGDTKSQSVDDIIAALREISKTASPEHLAAIRSALALGAEDKAVASAQHQIQDPANTALIRRKSFFQPGLATRDSSPNVLRKKKRPDASDRETSQTWSPDMFITSPLAQLANLKDGQMHDAVARAATPSECDYQLGAYKLGSLRVINGAASPEPTQLSAPRVPTSHTNLTRMQDYFTASDGTGSHCADERSTVDGASAPPTPGEGVSQQDTMYQPRLSQHLRPAPSAQSLRSERPSSRNMTRSPASPMGPRQPPLSRMKSAESWSSNASARPAAADYLSMYSTEASSNPFLSTYAAEEAIVDDDEDEEDEDDTVIHDPYHDSTFTHEPSLDPARHDQGPWRLNGPSISRSEHSVVLSETSSYYPDLPQEPEAHTHARPRLAYDSGYGSESSLRLEADAKRHSSPIYMHHEQHLSAPTLPNVGKLNVHGKPKASTDWAGTGQDEDMTPIHKTLSVPQVLHGVDSIDFFHGSLPVSPLERGTKSPSLLAASSYALSSPASTLNTPSKASAKSSPAASPRPNKLQKKRNPFQRAKSSPVVVQTAQEVTISDNVPAVPDEVVKKYVRRMSQNPEMENLEHTFRSVSACANRTETSSVMTNLETVEIRFPSPTPSPQGKRASSRGRKDQRRSLGAEVSPHRFLRSLSSSFSQSGERRKSGSMPRDDEELIGVELADFGTVAASLGSSPYEQATPMTARAPRAPTSRMPQPHQISYRPAPGKNLVGMSEEQASRLAMLRSRDRLMNMGNQMQQPGPRPLEARIRDIESNGEYRRPRPLSTAHGVPPVPMLPSNARTARPKSMYEQTNSRNEVLTGSPNFKRDGEGVQESPIADWNGTAKLWRQRRKSIGEGLLRRQYLGEDGKSQHEQNKSDEHHGHAPLSAGKGTTMPAWASHTVASRDNPSEALLARPQSQASRGTTGSRSASPEKLVARMSQSVHPLSAARTASPTQKIRDRAAMFERASAGNRGAPMPPRESADIYQRPSSAMSNFSEDGRRDVKLMGGPNMSMLSMSMQLRRDG